MASLPNRYGVNRSQIYTRLQALSQLDRSLVPEKRSNRAFIGRPLLDYLDSMAVLIEQGFTTDEAAAKVLAIAPKPKPQPDSSSDSLVRQDQTPSLADLMAMWLASSQPPEPEDDLAIFRKLQSLSDNNWKPSTSQLARMMCLKSLPPGDEFERYGFRFVKAGKNGSETAWRVRKV